MSLMRKRGRDRFSRVLFILPLTLILLAVLYQVFSYYTVQQGTLIVNTQTSDRYYPAVLLNATVSVAGRVGTAPMHLSLDQGPYTVTFSPIRWFHTPNDRQIVVLSGRTAYALGVYSPVIQPIEISENGFNITKISGMHGVTPVVWINRSGNFVVLVGDVFDRRIISPGQNFTMVYPEAGTYRFSIFGTSNDGTAQIG